MKITLAAAVVLALAAFCAAGAQAQAYRWKDSAGNVHYGDAPPPGVHATPLNLPAAPPAASHATQALTPAQEQQRFRKAQLEQRKAEEKAARAREQAQAKQQNCASARASLRTLESGQRVVTIDAKGERHYLDDAERAQQAARARKAVKQWCN